MTVTRYLTVYERGEKIDRLQNGQEQCCLDEAEWTAGTHCVVSRRALRDPSSMIQVDNRARARARALVQIRTYRIDDASKHLSNILTPATQISMMKTCTPTERLNPAKI